MLLAGLENLELKLPNTQTEINRIIKSVKAFSDNSQFTQLLNEAFTKRDLKKALIRKAHFAVHISSHAVFKADIKNT
jgi:CHAT domain-containing protein